MGVLNFMLYKYITIHAILLLKKRVTNPGVKSTGYVQSNKKNYKIQVKYDNVIIGYNNTCI